MFQKNGGLDKKGVDKKMEGEGEDGGGGVVTLKETMISKPATFICSSA